MCDIFQIIYFTQQLTGLDKKSHCLRFSLRTIEIMNDGVEEDCLLSGARIISSEIWQELKNKCQKELCIAL